MSLLDAIRGGVRILDKVTKPLQGTVMYARQTGESGYGPTFAAAVPLRAIIDYRAVQVRTREGELSATRATITLLDIPAIVAATGGAGIGNNDVFTLPDGDSGPTLDLSGFVDAGTGTPVATTVMMG